MGRKYRLLTTDDTFQVGDEVLNDDCEAWDTEFLKDENAPGRWSLGLRYTPGFFVPARRKLTNQK